MRFEYLKLLLSVSVLIAVLFISSDKFENQTTNLVASVFFQNSIETADVIKKYKRASTKNHYKKDVKIMIVPGHDNENSGAVLKDKETGKVFKEADLNLKVANELNKLLSDEKGIKTFLTRDEKGYHRKLAEYFEKESDKIAEFRESKKQIMEKLVEEGRVQKEVHIHHNTARPEVANVLYGINKYANDNEYDIIIHIHFNDYPGRTKDWGEYSGFSIYVPEEQYSNAQASHDFAEELRDQLLLSFAESDMPQEDAITQDQELIAIGAYNSVDSIAVLLEYGYIYESQFTDSNISDYILNELAQQTYLGIMDFLSGEVKSFSSIDAKKHKTFSNLEEYQWSGDLKKGDMGIEVLALQDFLRDKGFYPRLNTMNNCPINGRFGECTENALSEFQRLNDIEPTGYFGPQTRALINSI
jgi:N-acetylmuramoyl-L-alanine amidase